MPLDLNLIRYLFRTDPDADLSVRRPHQLGHHAKQCCLTRPVRPQDPHDLPFPYRQGNIVHCFDLTLPVFLFILDKSLYQMIRHDHVMIPLH